VIVTEDIGCSIQVRGGHGSGLRMVNKMVSVVDELREKAEEREERRMERRCVTEDCGGDPRFENGLCVRCMLKVSQKDYQREKDGE